MNKKFYRLLVLRLFISYPFRKTYTANICGHHTKRIGEVTSRGESRILSMPISQNGSPDYCLDCIAKMSIKCAWCDNTIHVGNPVTLYIPKESYKVPKDAVRYDKDRRRFVGCLGWNCAETGADRSGFWIPPGKVERVPSPLEMLMEKGPLCQGVIVSDLSDQSDLGKVI